MTYDGVLDNGLTWIAGTEKDFEPRMFASEPIGQFLPAHLGHNHIAQQEMDLLSIALLGDT